MSFSIAATTRRWLSPRHELSITRGTWQRLLFTLRQRGRGQRESGAFLLGRAGSKRHVSDFVAYDDLDQRCLDTGIVHFDGRHFGRLWEICAERSLDVVADVHTHPGGEFQSLTDQAHPMIAQAGHIALIIPRFAKAPVRPADLGIYRYLGRHEWTSVPRAERDGFLFISIW